MCISTFYSCGFNEDVPVFVFCCAFGKVFHELINSNVIC